MDAAIALHALRREVTGGVIALADATGEIPAGEFAAIVGPSGSGKTTLLSILGLLDRPTSGSYLLHGTDVSTLDERQRDSIRGQQLGFIFQNSYLVAADSVLTNVVLGLRVRGIPRDIQRKVATHALERVGLADAMMKKAGTLSGGEKQRVAVARALATQPKLILADEPTGALDSESTHNLLSLLHEVHDDGTTVVVVTHDPLVAESASRIFTLRDGVLYAEEETANVLR